MARCERHVVSHDRLGEALQGERANLFGGNASLQRDIDALTEQNLAVLGLGTEPGRDIAYRADCGVARAFGEPDLAQRRIALREYHSALGPLVSQFEGTLDQFSGDGIMVFFNDPVPIPDPAARGQHGGGDA